MARPPIAHTDVAAMGAWHTYGTNQSSLRIEKDTLSSLGTDIPARDDQDPRTVKDLQQNSKLLSLVCGESPADLMGIGAIFFGVKAPSVTTVYTDTTEEIAAVVTHNDLPVRVLAVTKDNKKTSGHQHAVALLDTGTRRDNCVSQAFVVRLGCEDAIETVCDTFNLAMADGTPLNHVGRVKLVLMYSNHLNKFEKIKTRFWVVPDLVDSIILCVATVKSHGLHEASQTASNMEVLASLKRTEAARVQPIMRFSKQSKEQKETEKERNREEDDVADEAERKLKGARAAARAELPLKASKLPSAPKSTLSTASVSAQAAAQTAAIAA